MTKQNPPVLEPDKWIDKYADLLFRYAIVRVNDEDTAKDLVQDSFLSGLKNLEGFRGEASEKSWLFSILKNKIIDHYRKQARRSTDSLDQMIEKSDDFFDEQGHWKTSALPQEWRSGEDDLETKEFYEIVRSCKNKLAELQRVVFSMKYLEDLDADEICKELEISSSNYWVILHRVRLQMRKCLEVHWFNK